MDKEAMGRLILEASTGMHGDVAKQLSDAWAEMANEVNRLEEKKQTLVDLAEANNRSKLEQITRLQARMKELKDELTHQLAWEHKAGNSDNQSHRYRQMHAVLHKE